MQHHRFLRAVARVILLTPVLPLSAGDFPLTLVARSGIAPPGRGSDFKLEEMDAPLVGRNGLISFYATVKYVGFENPLSVNRKAGLYAGTPELISWVNTAEHPAATPPATTRRDFTITTTNTSGLSLGRSIYTTTAAGGSTTTTYGLSLGSGSTAASLYRQDLPAPSFPTFRLFPFNGTIIDQNLTDSGRVTFLSLIAVDGEDTTSGIFTTDSPGSLTKIARTGEPTPDPAATFSSLGEPATSDNGTVVFGAALGGSVRNTIWSRTTAGNLQALVRPGFPAPTTPAGETFREIHAARQLAVKADGTTAFAATYGAAGQADKHGIFIGTPGNLSLVTTNGAAPGTGADFNHFAASLAESIRLNDNDTLVFVSDYLTFTPAYVQGQGVFARYKGNTVLLAKKGDSAPGTPAGVFFSTFDRNQIALNNRDEIVFRANLTGTGVVSGSNSSGFWSRNLATGATRLIVRDSDVLTSGPSVTSTARIEYSGAAFDLGRFPSRGGGKSGPLSDTGRFVFKVRYAAGTSSVANGDYAIYSADLAPPELTRLEAWRKSNFGTSANAGNAADTFVPGPDALPNLVRYALGLTAGQNGATDGSAPAAMVETHDGVSYPVLSFIHDPAATDVRLSVSISANAVAWETGNHYAGTAASDANPFTTELSRTPLPDGRERITVRGNQPSDSTPRQFLRLAAETP